MFAVTKKVAPKVIKYATPWYIRWIYSICGEEVHKMATSTVAPAENANTIGNASDSVVGVFCVSIFKSRVLIWFLLG